MFFKYLHFLNLKQFCGEYTAWNTLRNFCPDFPPDFTVWTSWRYLRKVRAGLQSWQIPQQISLCIMVTDTNFSIQSEDIKMFDIFSWF